VAVALLWRIRRADCTVRRIGRLGGVGRLRIASRRCLIYVVLLEWLLLLLLRIVLCIRLVASSVVVWLRVRLHGLLETNSE
jgi:hypothetical protein